MATYTVRKHPELDDIAAYDKDKLIEVIEQYKEWYRRHVKEEGRRHNGQALCFYAMYHIKDYLYENMVEELTTLKDTKGVEGEAYSVCPVGALLTEIDIIRRALLEKKVHPTLSMMQPRLLMDILNKLELCTRRVIQNTSIRRLHQRSWTHADALSGNHRRHVFGDPDTGELDQMTRLSHLPANTSTLLRDMKQLYV